LSENKTVRISVRIPQTLYEKLLEYMKTKGYIDISETIRDIIREKLLKQAEEVVA